MAEIKSNTEHGDLGISSVNVEKAITDIKENIEDVKSVFNTFSEIVESSDSYFQGEAGDALRKKFSKISYTFKTVETNLGTYVEDLTNLLNDYQEFEANYTASEIK